MNLICTIQLMTNMQRTNNKLINKIVCMFCMFTLKFYIKVGFEHENNYI